MNSDTLLNVKDMKVHFPVKAGFLSKQKPQVIKAVDGVTFSLEKGETLGLVGESGCGKSTTAMGILQLHRPSSGTVMFQDRELTQMDEETLRKYRRHMQIIFQDPYACLNPRMSVLKIIEEPLRVHKFCKTRKEQRQRALDLMQAVGLSPLYANRYPHEFSGGQRQRIGVARALAVQPEFIVCDEPVSALDVSIQAQIINLLEDLREQFNLTYLFISHDLSVVKHICHRVAVMYLGKIVETAGKKHLYDNPAHPYTRALLASVPIPDPVLEKQRVSDILKGEIPSPLSPPQGCHFHPRCPESRSICSTQMPGLRKIAPGHWAACHMV